MNAMTLIEEEHALRDAIKWKEYQYYDQVHKEKYRDKNQSRDQHVHKLATNLGTDFNHREVLWEILHYERFLPAGRIQAALGAIEREVSPFNCSVSRKIEDNIDSIYIALHEAAKILRLGTGIGYNFSHLRYKGALVTKLQSEASGPLSYMKVYNTSAWTIASAGHRRGAQMGILNVDHPDIEAFVDAKMTKGEFDYFNISVGITHAFMDAVKHDLPWDLVFNDKVVKTISAKALWYKIVQNAYMSAEPGIVFLERMNEMNNLYYCEQIEATNPCSEQPLPPFGLCTLGSFNLVAYLNHDHDHGVWKFNSDKFRTDIFNIVEAYDNIFDNAIYAIPQHKEEALSKRRIGLGLTGIANAIEMMIGRPSYGDPEFINILDKIAADLVCTAYRASVDLAFKRGPFPLYRTEEYMNSKFIKTLPEWIQAEIRRYGIRNSHLISYAPCGTISQIAGNVSSGVEPVFYHEMSRNVYLKSGKEKVQIRDWAWREYGFKGRTLEECTVDQHLAVAEVCQKYCDSAISKTINVPATCTYEEYESIYLRANELGLKGITVYRPSPEVEQLRGVVIEKAESPPVNTSELNTMSCASGVCER